MKWRTKRKLIYTILAISPLLVIAGIVYAATFFPSPTCNDGVQNQNETGIDCGGVCERLCQVDLSQPDIIWDQAFEVSDSVHNLAALVDNPNQSLIARDVPYRFRVFDQDNILISERYGQMDILPQPTTIAFESGVDTDGRSISRVDFTFLDPPFWERFSMNEVRFSTANRDLDVPENPRLSVDVTNTNTQPFRDIRLTALVLSNSGQVIHVSQTLIEGLDVQETESVIFTWRKSFPETSGSYQTQIIPTSYELGN